MIGSVDEGVKTFNGGFIYGVGVGTTGVMGAGTEGIGMEGEKVVIGEGVVLGVNTLTAPVFGVNIFGVGLGVRTEGVGG